jgi:hypothetical protein
MFALPGNVHDLAAAREELLAVLRNYTGKMPGLADCGYDGAGHGVLEIGPIAPAAIVLTLFAHTGLT